MTRFMHRRRAAAGRKSRRLGVEIVELAFALPVMTVLVFGTLETCELLFAKQSLAVAAYEAGRVAARPGATTVAVQNRFNQIVTSRRLQGVSLTLTPTNIDSVTIGQQIRLSTRAPVLTNTSTRLVLTAVPDMVETVVVLRE